MRELSLNILDIAQNSVRAEAKNIEIQLLEDINGWLTFRITDNGKGMDAETVRRVSDPFYTTRTTRRVGLGLPFLRMGAEMTGGSFSIKSKPREEGEGHGTVVTAIFNMKHIDAVPLGDMISTVCVLLQGQPDIDWLYIHSTPAGEVRLDAAELRSILGEEVSLGETEVINWIRDYLDEQYSSLNPKIEN
ncbi:MAG: sensor histidine kinase [Clostridia bacterium]|nr:sensor histidine kinase [Clostridia bacterium]